jgi:protein involved in polysaccharide export with SLBB domain
MRKLALLTCLSYICAASAQDKPAAGTAEPAQSAPVLTATSPQYVLRVGDVVQIKVYQEEDLTTLARIGKEGSITIPLLGSVNVVSNNLAQATTKLRDLLEKDYLVNPQVSLNVVEYAKRRFTVLGQVQRPGTYEMPVDDSVTLLQAIATAGGYTRIGNARKISVQRTVGSENKQIKLNADSMAADPNELPFVILPDDVIIVGEKWI